MNDNAHLGLITFHSFLFQNKVHTREGYGACAVRRLNFILKETVPVQYTVCYAS